MNGTFEYDPFRGLAKGSELLLAFSGGIDSSLCAKICLDAGYRVSAVTLKLLENHGKSKDEIRAVADSLGIKLTVLNCTDMFRDKILRYTWDEYSRGRTPNPCAVCNPSFKFGILAEYAKEKGFAGMVTGHYARIFKSDDSTMLLARGTHRAKDQSYFLFGLSQEQLAYSYMPLGAAEKTAVRESVREMRLPNAEAPESQDACFTPPDGDLTEMLKDIFSGTPKCGNFIGRDGKILGRHEGVHAYTIGQRKGTGVAMGKPAYVSAIDAEACTVTLTTESADLFAARATLSKPNWIMNSYEAQDSFQCEVQIRYRSKPVPATVNRQSDGLLELVFNEPQRAVTPGQAAVFYKDDFVIGGAWIDSAVKE